MLDTKDKQDVTMMCHMVITAGAFIFCPVLTYEVVADIFPVAKNAENPCNLLALGSAVAVLATAGLAAGKLAKFGENMGEKCHRRLNGKDKSSSPQPR